MDSKELKFCLNIVIGFLLVFAVCFGYTIINASTSMESMIEDVDIDIVVQEDLLLDESYSFDEMNFITFDEVEKDSDIGVEDMDAVFDDIENISYESLKDMNIVEIHEEFYTPNYLANREKNVYIGSSEYSYTQKFLAIFGRYPQKKGFQEYYPLGQSQADSNMASFYVYVWDIDENGEWVVEKHYFICNKVLKNTFELIFSELLELPEEERVPIHDLWCYEYREGLSCHSCGVALDINSNENAEMTNTGIVTAGSYWKPYEDIYSIPEDSKMVEIFHKYGFSWGGEWTSKKDYMHFSYFE